MNLSRRRLFAAAALLPALAACGLMPPPEMKTPQLSFGALSVSGIGLENIDFLLTVIADNPNDFEIPLTNLRFGLDLFGEPFATGAPREPRLSLPRLTRREVPIAFAVPTSRLLTLLSRSRNEGLGRFEYRLHGSANWGNSPFAIPFEKSGELDALKRLGKMLRPTGT